MNEHYPLALLVGTNVNGYVINKVIGQGGFGITYLAYDTATDKTVALKEYFPSSLVLRNNGATVTPQSVGGENDFAQGKISFLKEAQTLGKFRHKSIVQVLGYFEANGTAYTVMEFVKGETLAHRIKQLKAEGKTMPEKEIRTWFNSVMDGLDAVHSEQFLHRDIKPENIMLNPETGEGCLLDFGAARHDAGGKTKSLSVVLTPGFAPIEQYSSNGKGQGTWTDIYALGATVWCAMTGEAPTDAPGRSTEVMYKHPDPIALDKQKLIAKGYSASLVNTAMKMMALNSTERLKTIAYVKESLAHQEPNVSKQNAYGLQTNVSLSKTTPSITQDNVGKNAGEWHEQLGATSGIKEEEKQAQSMFFYIKKCLLHFLDFKGRASRKEYWSFQCFYVLFKYLCAILIFFSPLPSVIFELVCYLPNLTVTTRRVHDIGYSTWIALTLFFVFRLLWFNLGFYATRWLLNYIWSVVYPHYAMLNIASSFTFISFAIVGYLPFYCFLTRNSQPEENKWGAMPNEKFKINITQQKNRS